MRDATIDRQVDILSGNAETRLQDEKYEIIRQRARQKEAHQMRRSVLAKLATPAPGVLPTIAALTDHERRRYSLQKLVSNLAGFSQDRGLEHEISASIAQDLGQVPQHGGCYIPFAMSGLDTRTNAAGDYLVPTKVTPAIIDALRAQCAVLRLGATVLSGVRTNFQLPVEDSILASSWLVENSGTDLSPSDPSVQARTLHPHPMQATTSISRQLLKQSSTDMNLWLSNRLAKAHALLLDSAAIAGPGTGGSPLGILNTANIGSVAIGGNGGAVAASHLVALESSVGTANGDVGALGFLTNTGQRSKMRALPEFAGGTTPLWDDNSLLDYPAVASNQVPANLVKGSANNCSAVIFGNWNNLLVVEFDGVMELVIDEVTKVRQGEIELTSYASYDCALTLPASMAAIQDAI